MKYWIVAYFILVFHLFAAAQPAKNFFSLSVEEGLSQNSVWDVLQDSKGYLWISTADGINRFDGYTFKYYQNVSNDSNSIAGVGLFKFFEDSENRIWVTHDKGISLYDRVHDNFQNVYYSPVKSGVVFSANNFIGEDSKKGLWALIANVGFVHVSFLNFKVNEVIAIKEFQNISYYFQHLEKIKENCFVQIAEKVVLNFDIHKKSYTIINFEHLNSKCFAQANNNTLFYFNKNYRFEYNIKQKSWTKNKIKSKVDLLDAKIFDCIEWNGDHYFGGLMGLFVYNFEKNEIVNFIKNFSNSSIDNYVYVQNIRTDKIGNIWICTNGAGLKCLSPSRNKFQHFRTDDSKLNMIKSICKTNDGKLFVGIFENGLAFFDSLGIFHKSDSKDILKFPSKSILAANYFDENQLLLVNRGSICLYDYEKRKIIFEQNIYKGTINFPNVLSWESIFFINSNDAIFSVDKSKVVRKIIALKDQIITSFIMSGGKIWIGTVNGLYIYDMQSKKVFQSSLKKHIKSICKTSNNKYFVATTNGLFVFNANAKQIANYSTEKDLKSNFIYAVLEAKNGEVWFSHNAGLSKYNPHNNLFTHFSIDDGLQSNEFNTGAYFKDADGALYFGGINGINIIDPEKIKFNNYAPKIGLNSIYLFDEPYKSDISYNEIKNLSFSYLQNTISFDFSALDFSKTKYNSYAYQLVNWDKNWIESGTKHFARYANLPAGEYVFKIRVANGDGYWSKDVKEIDIKIDPPFWETKWFYFLVSISIVSMLFSLVYYFAKKQRAKLQAELAIQKGLEQERLRISRDLHDNVGAQLSYLISNMDWLAEHANELTIDEKSNRFKALSETGREAILTLRQTIWAISQNELSVEDFADRFKQFALKMIEFDKSLEIQFSENIDNQQTLNPALALNLFRICQEAFSNALKHAKCTKFQIRFLANENIIFGFELIDNGIGFDANNAERNGHYGLLNMKARAMESTAQLQIDSVFGKGTVIKLELYKHK